jgi:hypothetical protein
VHPHGHPTRAALDEAHQVEGVAPEGHAIDDGDAALVGVEDGLQHEGARAVATLDPSHLGGRGDLPAAVVRGAEQGGEAGRRVEAWKRQPVDRPVPPHQRR